MSKTLAPAIRLGWLVCPARWVEPMWDARRRTDLGVSVIEQLTLTEMLTNGGLDKYLRRMRQRYRTRRELLLTALATHLPTARVGGIPAGLHVTVTLDRLVDEQALLAALGRDGIRIALLSDYSAGSGRPDAPDRRTHLVLGFGGVPARRIDEGVARLAAAIGQM